MKKILLTILSILFALVMQAQCMEDLMKALNNNTHLIEPFSNDPTLVFAWNTIKSRPQMSMDLDILNATNRMLKENGGWLAENEELFNNILESLGNAGARCRSCLNKGNNLGIPFIDVTIDNINNLIKRTDQRQSLQRLLNDMGASGQKADGAAFILNVLSHKSDEFLRSITGFEYRYLDDANFEADLVLNTGKKIEYKSFSVSSWESFGSINQINQFKAYVRAPTGSFEYVANAAKLNSIAGNPTEFIRKQFQRMIRKEGVAEELFESNKGFFSGVIFNNKSIVIDNGAQLRKYLELDDFYKSSLFDIIKVE